MTDRTTKQAMCEGKHRQTRERAKIAAKRMRRKGERVEAYRCHFCRNWHVGSIASREAVNAWEPRPDKGRDRPTPQRKQKGEWAWVTTERAGAKAVRDLGSHPIDRLEHSGVLSNQQASTGRSFERLVRAATQTPAPRDSTLLWQPKGHESDDGNVDAVKRYREISRRLGMIRDRLLQAVCVEGNEPRDVGELREALNEAGRFL